MVRILTRLRSGFDFINTQKAFATKVKRYRTISIIQIRWGYHKLDYSLGVKCLSDDNYWGFYRYIETLQQYVLLGFTHYSTLLAATFRNQDMTWMPLVTTLSSSLGNSEIFADAHIPGIDVYAANRTRILCTPAIEKLVGRQMANHYFSGHPLYATYLAGFFFFLQFAAVRSRSVVLGKTEQWGADLDGNVVDYYYALQIPSLPVLVSTITSMLVLLAIL